MRTEICEVFKIHKDFSEYNGLNMNSLTSTLLLLWFMKMFPNQFVPSRAALSNERDEHLSRKYVC